MAGAVDTPRQASSDELSSPPRSQSPDGAAHAAASAVGDVPAPNTPSSSIVVTAAGHGVEHVLAAAAANTHTHTHTHAVVHANTSEPLAVPPSASASASASTSTSTPTATSTSTPPVKERKKPGRKPKPRFHPDGTPNLDAPKPRAPRKPKVVDPNAPASAPALVKGPRKKKDLSLPSDVPIKAEPYASLSALDAPAPAPAPAHAHALSQSGNSEAIPMASFFTPATIPSNANQPQPQPQPQPQLLQPVRTSGQNYDPIRSNYDPVRETANAHHPYGNNAQGSPVHLQMNRASASPSIASLVDPPNQPLASPSANSFFNLQQQQVNQRRDPGHSPVPQSPASNRLASAAVVDQTPTTFFPPQAATRPSSPPAQARKADTLSAATQPPKKATTSTSTSSTAASPKAAKAREPKETYPSPPPLPGSGLMQLGGIGGGANDGTEFRAPTVILTIPMQGEVNKYVNFTRLAEERYGWDALHPRLAAQRDRLARVAAAGAALERNGSGKESGDEMSLDSEGEGSNAEMGGMSDGRTGTDGGAKKIPRKRKMKEDDYDKEDGFVDDSELLWEEQAAAASDGFFVYSGPLVPEVEKPAVELRADGLPKRGRGARGPRGGVNRANRGGGAVGGGGRGGAAAATGPGSRGGTTTRKPRITKADRARMEQEKIDRQALANLAQGTPGSYSAAISLNAATTLGTTPMVFNQ